MVLGVIDIKTGYELSFSVFYLVPVFFVTWFGNRNQGVLFSLLSAGTWLWADLASGHVYSHFAVPIWNSIMRSGFFLIVAYLLSKIKLLLEREQTLARMDSLTGIFNSRAFHEMAAIDISRSARFGRPFTIAYIDVDDFKQVNDTLGHSEGDVLLRSIARTIKDNTRSIDIVARLGGDEFCILFAETNEENAQTALKKIQNKLMDITRKNSWAVTFSIGAITCHKSCNLEDLIKEADNLMYSIKQSGKNRIDLKTHEKSVTGHNT